LSRRYVPAEEFRAEVSPVYLRRHQKDVLAELPRLIHIDDWVTFSRADKDHYRAAVTSGNFMAMRSAAYADPAASAKLNRLREIVKDAAEHDLKVVVFSYFVDVLDVVYRALGPAAAGPLTGSRSVARWQQMVDAFTGASGHAVLLSQIQSGGTGINLQAASVVIICEPQIKPALEHQAIARAHRMGQVRAVRAHRLLAEDSADERLIEILACKDRIFDYYARRSNLAEGPPKPSTPRTRTSPARSSKPNSSGSPSSRPKRAPADRCDDL
jgi:SNF2 family DNA or RNA helicase